MQTSNIITASKFSYISNSKLFIKKDITKRKNSHAAY